MKWASWMLDWRDPDVIRARVHRLRRRGDGGSPTRCGHTSGDGGDDGGVVELPAAASGAG
jgi:hypothetical protein